MNQSILFRRAALALLMCFLFAGCGSKPNDPEQEVTYMPDPMPEPRQEVPVGEEPIPDVTAATPWEEEDLAMATPGGAPINEEDYYVSLDVTKNIEKHENGTLRVWIGLDEENMPAESALMERAASTMRSEACAYARIAPYAPDFTVEPADPVVVPIDSGGSDVIFTLYPKKDGEFMVGARIELFKDEECTGKGTPKSSDFVSVTVTVDNSKDVKSHLAELWKIFWDYFLKFWGAFVAVILGALIFVIRKYLKKKTGYDEKGISKEE
ncbi:MAG: hypothetical protein IKV62_10545 [Bacteroidales bacterium]|nr:hypothetical protein [Bacteroidales bacterium]